MNIHLIMLRSKERGIRGVMGWFLEVSLRKGSNQMKPFFRWFNCSVCRARCGPSSVAAGEATPWAAVASVKDQGGWSFLRMEASWQLGVCLQAKSLGWLHRCCVMAAKHLVQVVDLCLEGRD